MILSKRIWPGLTGLIISVMSLLVIPGYTFAQRYFTHTYTEAEGLANSTTYQAVQDSSGAIWFATRGGITRYDGLNWITYTASDGLYESNNSLITVDQKGYLWALPNSGDLCISVFDGNTWDNNFSDDTLFGISSLTGMEVYYENNQAVVVISSLKEGIYILKEGEWIHIGKAEGLQGTKVFGIAMSDDNILVATDEGLSVIRDEIPGNTLRDIDGLPAGKILGIKREEVKHEGRIIDKLWLVGQDWIGYIQDSMFTLLDNNFSIQLNIFQHNIFVTPDGDGGAYFGNPFQLYFISEHSENLEPLGSNYGLISEGATSVFIDRERNIWITGLRGVTKIPSKRFANFYKDDGLFDNEVTSIIESEPGKLIFGHYGGLTFYDGTDYNLVDLNFVNDNSIQPSRIQDLDLDEKGNVWGAVSYLGIVKISKDKKVTWFDEDDGVTGNVTTIIVTQDDKIYAANEKGLLFLNENNFEPAPYNEKVLNVGVIRKLFESKDGNLIIAFSKQGIGICIDNDVNIVKSDNNPLGNRVYSFFEDSEGTKWVGTIDGLYRIKDSKLVKVKQGKLSLDRSIYLLIEDSENNLWFGTDNGIYKWNGENLINYTVNDGLAGQELNRDAGLLDSHNNLWFGTNNGLSLYRHDFDSDPDSIPAPVIALLFLEAGDDSLILNNEIDLSYRQNNLIFHFSGISFIDEEQIFYQCKLEGFDEKWTSEFRSINGQIRYNNLPSGHYQFCIKARNILGTWSQPVCSDTIVILRPFWRAWWFVMLYAGIIALIAFLLYRILIVRRYNIKLEESVLNRTLELRNSEDKLKESNDAKDRFFSIIAHDLKNPFTAILGLTDILITEDDKITGKKRTHILQNLRSASTRTIDLLDNLLTWARAQKGAIPFEPQRFELGPLIEENLRLFETTANSKNISMINLSNNHFMVYADKNMINTVIRNLISNAIKFTYPEGRVIINAMKKQDEIEITVKDNGRGISADILENLFSIDQKITTKGTDNETGTGLGLILCKEFVERNKGHIMVVSDENAGTRIIVSLPSN